MRYIDDALACCVSRSTYTSPFPIESVLGGGKGENHSMGNGQTS